MKRREQDFIFDTLQNVPAETVEVIHHNAVQKDATIFTERFQANTNGKGRAEVYAVFPGVEAAFHAFLSTEASFHHDASSSVLDLYHCRRGRIGWNMKGGTAVYLGAGDLSVHSTDYCADSVMMFPVGYSEGISISVDLERLAGNCPAILREAGFSAHDFLKEFCVGRPIAIPFCTELDGIFVPLYVAPASLRLPYLKLKIQELLLYLGCIQPEHRELPQYVLQQIEQIKEIHRLLTEHLEQRFTIAELSKQYLLNTSTLKEVFKAVYGQPIASYMKEYRVRRAMEMLRQTDASVADIAVQVGYETQGKFSQAFKDIVQMLPTEYRKHYRIR